MRTRRIDGQCFSWDEGGRTCVVGCAIPSDPDKQEPPVKKRLAVPVLLLVLFALLPAAPAAAINWGIGADLGYNLFMPDYDDVENITVIGLPLCPGAGETATIPVIGGLRVSFTGEKPTHEIWLGTSINRFGVEDYSIMSMQLSGNYQFNFATQGGLDPYVTAGVGLYRVGYSADDDSESAMSTYFGGGVGVAYKMGTGRLRAEARYDVVSEGEVDNDPVIPKGGNLGLKLGFDLWNK